MAGVNKILKDSQILFKAGDKSDGMYLIRRGELRVYLTQGDKEVVLATVGSGGMIGEMALFDKQPRSASVKAVGEAEVTLISDDDFAKLMKQIPKWFVALMASLSGRLRTTNERLQKLENGSASSSSAKPYQDVNRIINIMILLWNKDGEKEGKEWIIEKATIEKTLVETFEEDTKKFAGLLEILSKFKVITVKLDRNKNSILSTASRGSLKQLATFISQHAKNNPQQLCLSDPAIDMLSSLENLAQDTPYDSITISLEDLIREGKRGNLDTSKWEDQVESLIDLGDEVKVIKSGSSFSLKATKKDIGPFVRQHQILAALCKAGLS